MITYILTSFFETMKSEMHVLNYFVIRCNNKILEKTLSLSYFATTLKQWVSNAKMV